MTNGIIKQTSKKAQDEARKAAKQLRQEPLEMLKSAKTQVSPDTEKKEKEEGDGNLFKFTNVSEVGPEEERAIRERAKKRILELEEELKSLRAKREKTEDEWKRDQEEVLQTQKPSEDKPLIEPTTRPKRGMIGMVKKKQGTKEMGKQMSG